MGIWSDVARVATALNVLLLLSLIYVWGRNYLELRSKHPLGLTIFAVFLLAENALAFFYYVVDPTLSVWFSTEMPPIAWRATMALHVLETVGLAFLAWITWD